MTIYIATLDTAHFTFTTFGTTAAAAKGYLVQALRKHGKTNNLKANWFADLNEDIVIEQIVEGDAIVR